MTIPPKRLRELLSPYFETPEALSPEDASPEPLADDVLEQLNGYLALLLKWNARTNLTSIGGPEQMVQRHFGESLFLARCVRPLLPKGATVLDFGSGAGFPGLPLQILYPDLLVTLAESQGKKAAFLREATRSLALRSEVWAERVERMPTGRTFDLVTMRAVDKWSEALKEARKRVASAGVLALLIGRETPATPTSKLLSTHLVPGTRNTHLQLLRP